MKQKPPRINLRKRTAIRPDGREIPVVDGIKGFIVPPNAEDIKYGVPGDHANCMYCLACRRMYGSTLVWITRTGVVYVEIPVEDGTELQRYFAQDPALRNLRNFDALKHVSKEAVWFNPPTGSHTLDAMAEARRRRRYFAKQNGQTETPKGAEPKKAYIKGTISGKKPPQKKRIQSKTMTLRSRASGMFHFKEAA